MNALIERQFRNDALGYFVTELDVVSATRFRRHRQIHVSLLGFGIRPSSDAFTAEQTDAFHIVKKCEPPVDMQLVAFDMSHFDTVHGRCCARLMFRFLQSDLRH
jgi:hypothetical protein